MMWRLFKYNEMAESSWKWVVAVVCTIFVVVISFLSNRLLRYLKNQDANRSFSSKKKPIVVFVLGGPGSGKSTQCAYLVKHFGYTHLSAGDLLRAERNSGSENSAMIQNIMQAGGIIPGELTVKLLQKAMQDSKNNQFLIDGFPRNKDNVTAFENITKIEPECVLFLVCSEDELKKRLLNRNQGREDDNTETIKDRFKVFKESTSPVIEYYKSKGKVREIDAGKSPDEVFGDIKSIFSEMTAKVSR